MVGAGLSSADFGGMIRQARETRGLSLRQIATSTKISVAALEALERNDISRLPGGIFGRAFVRSYALQVGLDPDETVRVFLEQFPFASFSAGSRGVPPEDFEAVESSREIARTTLELILISAAIGAALLYFTSR